MFRPLRRVTRTPRCALMREVVVQSTSSEPMTPPPQHGAWERTGPMALGRGTDVRLAESVSATARALRKTGGPSRGILVVGLRSDLLECSCTPQEKRFESPLLLILSWVSAGTSAASGGSLAGDEVVTFGLGVRFDSGQVRAPRGRLSRLHFDFSER
jgi:hypothetical protein